MLLSHSVGHEKELRSYSTIVDSVVHAGSESLKFAILLDDHSVSTAIMIITFKTRVHLRQNF